MDIVALKTWWPSTPAKPIVDGWTGASLFKRTGSVVLFSIIAYCADDINFIHLKGYNVISESQAS